MTARPAHFQMKEVLALFPGMDGQGLRCGNAEGRQLHDKERRFAPEERLFEEKAHPDGQDHAKELQRPEDRPGMGGEERPREDDVDGQPGAAGHERDEKRRQGLVLLVFERSCCIDGRDVASESQEHRDKGLSMKSDDVHGPVHDKGRPGHIAATSPSLINASGDMLSPHYIIIDNHYQYKAKKNLLPSASLTDAVEVHFVVLKLESVLGGESPLQFLDDGVADLDGPPTGPADQVVVVLVAVVMFIAHDAVAEIHLPGKARFAQELQDPVEGGLANGPIPHFDDVVELLRGGMRFPFQELVENEPPLRRLPQAFSAEEVLKYLSFSLHWLFSIE